MKQPPVLAAWMLKHLTAGEPDEGLAGDLLEELRLGRPSVWYWRQMLAAILASYRRVIAEHWTALVFAVFWSSLAPAWEWLVRAGDNQEISRAIHGLGWPWTPLFRLILSLSLRLAFVWGGLLLYIVVDRRWSGGSEWRRFRSGFLRSWFVFAPVWVPLHLVGDILATSLQRSRSEMWSTSFNVRWAMETLAFFVTTLFAIWADQHTQTNVENASDEC